MVKSKMLIAAVLACTTLPAFAIDLAPEDSAELRSRADGLIAERQRNPGWDGGTSRLATRGDVDLSQSRGEVKPRPHGEVKAKPKGSKKPKSEPVKKTKSEPVTKKIERTASEIPGALVRKH